MREDNLNEKIVALLKKALPEEENIVDTLMDVLYLGRKSVYRRLSGEVPFTLLEAATLIKSFKFSIDDLLGYSSLKNSLNITNILGEPNVNLNGWVLYLKSFAKAENHTNSKTRYVLDSLLHIVYKSVVFLKLRYLYVLYQQSQLPPGVTYQTLVIPPRLIETWTRFVKYDQATSSCLMILSRNIFKTFKQDIEYFFQIRLINEEDLQIIKNEVLIMMSNFEKLVSEGVSDTGQKVSIYLSNINLGITHKHYEFGDEQFCHIRVFGSAGIYTQCEGMCTMQREWIDSLKKSSTLISESGHVQRYEFFSKQRELIESMGE